ncbi:MAG TPA: NAD(P)H-hydrate epimerase [Phycisphaerales bacterium]|nr:NAD(P)H-hydrate epimerase [Phycisphaerales bacterium]
MRPGEDSERQHPGEAHFGPDPRAALGTAPEPVLVFSRAAAREVDRAAREEYGLPTIVLMENAAHGLRGVVEDLADQLESDSVLICCGSGSNGGDGLALARLLDNDGFGVTVLLAAPEPSFRGDAALHLAVARRMNLKVVEAGETDPAGALGELVARTRPGVLVDCLIGTGLDRPVQGPMAALVDGINRVRQEAQGRLKVVAADLPSGLDADSGRPWGGGKTAAVRADVTVTFVGHKLGFTALEAQQYIGEVIVRGIGAPAELTRRLGQPMQLAQHPGNDGTDQDEWSLDEEDEPGDEGFRA